jgi:hypothetical protein
VSATPQNSHALYNLQERGWTKDKMQGLCRRALLDFMKAVS